MKEQETCFAKSSGFSESVSDRQRRDRNDSVSESVYS